MARLITIVIVALLLGVIGGYGSFQMENGGIKERFAKFDGAATGSAGSKKLPDSKRVGGDLDVSTQLGNPIVEVVNGKIFNFGTMQKDSEKSHGFVFRNKGETPMTLKVVSSTCKCTIGSLEKSVVHPGEETTVTLTWKAKGLVGDFSQMATIGTNDPTQLEVNLGVEGRLIDKVGFSPVSVELGEISATVATSRTVRLYCYEDMDFEVKSVSWEGNVGAGLVTTEVRKLDIKKGEVADFEDAYSGVEIDMNIAPGMPMGPINARLQVATNVPDAESIALPITGTVVSDMSIVAGRSFDPERSILSLGEVKSSEGRSIKMFLTVKGPEHMNMVPGVLSIDPDDALDVKFEDPIRSESSTRWPMVVEVPVGAPKTIKPGTQKDNFGKIVINATGGYSTELSIYVRFVVQEE